MFGCVSGVSQEHSEEGGGNRVGTRLLSRTWLSREWLGQWAALSLQCPSAWHQRAGAASVTGSVTCQDCSMDPPSVLLGVSPGNPFLPKSLCTQPLTSSPAARPCSACSDSHRTPPNLSVTLTLFLGSQYCPLPGEFKEIKE